MESTGELCRVAPSLKSATGTRLPYVTCGETATRESRLPASTRLVSSRMPPRTPRLLNTKAGAFAIGAPPRSLLPPPRFCTSLRCPGFFLPPAPCRLHHLLLPQSLACRMLPPKGRGPRGARGPRMICLRVKVRTGRRPRAKCARHVLEGASEGRRERVRQDQMRSSENQRAPASWTRNASPDRTLHLSAASLPRVRRFGQKPRAAACGCVPVRVGVGAGFRRRQAVPF